MILFHGNTVVVPTGSASLLRTHAAAREWLTEKDAMRLDASTKHDQRWVQVEVKAILVEQPLLGQGHLSDWLRNKRGPNALDTYNDNLCFAASRFTNGRAQIDAQGILRYSRKLN